MAHSEETVVVENKVFVVRCWEWFFSLRPPQPLPKDPTQILLRAAHITAKSRYNASIRLTRLGRFSFLTATVLSLGLILIPVLQLTDMHLAYPPKVLNGLQIFLAVAVLVYSVINGTARYEARAQALNDCGDRLKDLTRDLRSMLAKGPVGDLELFNQRYTSINRDSEMHSRADYALATLQASDMFKITGLKRLLAHVEVWAANYVPYIIPSALMIGQVLLILDVLGVTQILTPNLQRLSQPPVAISAPAVQPSSKTQTPAVGR